MSETTNNIVFTVEWREYTLHDVDGTQHDEPARNDSSLGPDFTSLAGALAWASEQASHDKLEIVTATRYGNGTVSRNIYEVRAYTTDEDGETVPCSYDGEPWEDNDNESIDVLDLHPEVRKAWERANGSFCSWLNYEDGGEGFGGFRDALEDALGEGWDELRYIDWR